MSSRPAHTIPEEKGHVALEVGARAAALFAAVIGVSAQSRTALLRHVLAPLPPLLAFVLQWTFWPAIKPYAWFLFYPAVFFSSWIGGLAAGLMSSLVSVALVWWFFIPPEHMLMKERPESLLSAGMFMGMGVFFSISHGRLRKANATTASALAAAHSANEQLQLANEKITALFEKTRELDQLKTQFFANVSHELRIPLALILGPTEALLASTTIDDSARRDLDVVARNARLLLKHVNDLLDVSKLEAGKMKLRYAETDQALLVRLVASHFESLAQEKHIEYVVEADGVQAAQIDPAKYQRVLLNLLSNAFKYTPAGGRIRCSLQTLRMGETGQQAVLEVGDSGPGVHPEDRETVFERFRQVERGMTRHVGGTGLGLSIARDFVKLHGGAISVTGASEGGALFRVETPILAPQGSEVVAAAPEAPVIAEAAYQAVKEVESCQRF